MVFAMCDTPAFRIVQSIIRHSERRFRPDPLTLTIVGGIVARDVFSETVR
jgi:hypothetical protein